MSGGFRQRKPQLMHQFPGQMCSQPGYRTPSVSRAKCCHRNILSVAGSSYLLLSTINHIMAGYLLLDSLACLFEEVLDKFPAAHYALIALLPDT